MHDLFADPSNLDMAQKPKRGRPVGARKRSEVAPLNDIIESRLRPRKPYNSNLCMQPAVVDNEKPSVAVTALNRHSSKSKKSCPKSPALEVPPHSNIAAERLPPVANNTKTKHNSIASYFPFSKCQRGNIACLPPQRLTP
jgi:hypothetical protein